MRRLSWLLLLTLVGCAHPKPQPAPSKPPSATQIVVQSLIRITVETHEDGTFTCTGFSIAPRKYVTAAHCTVPLREYPSALLYADGRPAFVVAEDTVTDLAVIVVDLVKPALGIRERPLTADPVHGYEAVQAAGYGYAFSAPLITNHVVSLLNYVIQDDIYPGTVFMGGFIGGMSGGPVYDTEGQVVGVVQRATSQIGYGISSETLLKFLAGVH